MSETTAMFNPFAPGYAADPYTQYDELYRAGPVLESPLGGWQLFAYDDCFRLLREPGTSVEPESVTTMTERDLALQRSMDENGREPRRQTSILTIDPPDHTRLRKLVARVFTPRAINELGPLVQTFVDEALDAVDPGAPVDLISTLAFPLPFQVISVMLGLPDDGRMHELRDWSHTLVQSLDPVFDDDVLKAIVEAGDHMTEYLSEVITWKRANPADDLLSGMIEAHDDGDRMTDDELQDQLQLLFIAGHETTVNLIGNGTLALLQHPDQLQRLRDDPGLITTAVEEMLRFDPPVQMTRRITTAPMTFRDIELPPGTFVMAMTAAANRDPDRWGPTAAEFDIGRHDANHHLSFGSGIHHCLGAALARMEAAIAIGRLVERAPGLALAGDIERNNRIVLRGLERLPVTLGERAPANPA